MLRDRLTGHVQPLAKLAKPLAILPVQPVQQLPAASVGQSAKHSVLIHANNMEPCGYPLYGTSWLPVKKKAAPLAALSCSMLEHVPSLPRLETPSGRAPDKAGKRSPDRIRRP